MKSEKWTELETTLVEVKESEKPVLCQLLELYAYDFSEYDDADLNEYGRYGYTYFENYWTEKSRHPFFIKVDGKFGWLCAR